MNVQTFSQTHIDVVVESEARVGWWHLIGFCCNPDISKQPELWAKLKHLKATSTLPWLVIGDFNELIGLSKKEGGSARLRQQMQNFIDTINFCGLRDIGDISPQSHDCAKNPMAHRFGKGLIGPWQQRNGWLFSQQPNYFTLLPRLLTITHRLSGWCKNFRKGRQRKCLDSSPCD